MSNGSARKRQRLDEECERTAELHREAVSLERRVVCAQRRATLSTLAAATVSAKDIVNVSVGGVHYSAPRATLLSEPGSLFHRLLRCDDVRRDCSGVLLIDRDGTVFRHILNFLRGYPRVPAISPTDLALLQSDVDYYQLPRMKAELGLHAPPTNTLYFQKGPGVNPDGTRLRTHYMVGVIGDRCLVVGVHDITFEVLAADYVGIGVVSDQCSFFDQEFFRTLDCVVYYRTGVFFSNCPEHRKEEGLRRLDPGMFVTLRLDLSDFSLEFIVNGTSEKTVALRPSRYRFAATMKEGSSVRIVPRESWAFKQACREPSPLQPRAGAISPSVHRPSQI